MPELAASIRVALWTTHAWSLGADAESIVRQALPDVDIVLGLVERLTLWRELGEMGVYASLPRPGASGILPTTDAAGFDAAVAAGEAIFVAGVGGIAVPRLVTFGTDDGALATRWESFDADPVPVHRLAGADVAGADQRLRLTVHSAIDALGDGGWVDAWRRERADQVERHWSLPQGLPERARGLIVRAASVLQVADLGLEHASGSSSTHLATARTAALLPLRDAAIDALEAATAASVSYLAAQSRSTRS